MAKKTWAEKLHPKKELPEVKEIECKDLIKRTGPGKMVIPSPWDIDKLMKSIPEGVITTAVEIRNYHNLKYDAVYTCPMCTGIFSNIAAHASEEREQEGIGDITPYWRTLKSNGELNPKYPGGLDNQKQKLESEGHIIVQKGKRMFVKDYEKALLQLRP